MRRIPRDVARYTRTRLPPVAKCRVTGSGLDVDRFPLLLIATGLRADTIDLTLPTLA